MNYKDPDDIQLLRQIEEKYKKSVLPKLMELEEERQSLLKSRNNRKFQKIVKEKYLEDLLDCIGFVKSGDESGYSVFNSGLVMPQPYDGKMRFDMIDDRFHGTYKGVNFNITEVRNCNILSNMMSVNYRDWGGIVINFTFNKNIYSDILVIPKTTKKYLLPTLVLLTLLTIPVLISIFYLFSFGGDEAKIALSSSLILFLFFSFMFDLMAWKIKLKHKKEVHLEDKTFHKKYLVQASNQVEARYVLTPAFMERLNNLKTDLSAKEVWCKFKGNQATIAFETEHDMFEIGDLHRPMSDISQVSSFFDEIILITDIIDHFKYLFG